MPAIEAPYFGDGSLANYPNYSPTGYRSTEMMPIVPFLARLKLVDYERGRSAVNFIFKDEATQRTYPMFLKDFFELVKSQDFAGGYTGTNNWTVVKRGQNYGIMPA